MTVIAWDGKTLSADKQTTAGSMKRKLRKITRLDNGHLIGATGNSTDCKRYMEWYDSVCKKEVGEFVKFPTWQGDSHPHLMVVTPWKGVYMYTGTDEYLDYTENDVFAIGSGAEYALGAMRAGADSVKAIEIASEFDAYCGMGIDSIELEVEVEDTVTVTLTAEEAKKAIRKKSKPKVVAE